MMSQRFLLFIRANVPDFLLALALSVALSYAILSGFDASLNMRTQFALEALIAGVFLLICYVGAWSRGMRIVSIVVALLYAVGAVIGALAMTPAVVSAIAEGAVNDVEGNYAIFVIVLLVVALFVYLMSRSRAGVVILAIVAVFSCGVTQFLFRAWLFEEGGLVDSVLVLGICVAFVIYQRYRVGIVKSDQRARPSFAMGAIVGVVAAMASVGIAALLFMGIIAPLNLETPVLKPFEHHIIPPIVDYTGANDQYLVEDPEVFSSLLNEREDATSQNAEGGSVPDEEQTETASSPLMRFLQSIAIFSEDDWSEDFDPVTIDRMHFGFLFILVFLLSVVIGLVLLRMSRRKARLHKMRDESYDRQVIYLYGFLLSRLKRLKMGKPDTSTPLEFAYDSRRKLVPFTRKTGKVDFVKVTLVYQRAAYGLGPVSQEDYDGVCRYYRAFFGNAHRHVGTLKWLWKFWRI